ncbi:hypothetical protein CO540_13175 [Micromonospora sp. WMMA2032]|uniref:hypothetical protein n=1 Tax=Micromonospora sp. WMMA2032 TaxID=2039870 RepID=UPI000C05819E|nr:hypothetical protein [Micromonospora sp. WMMA2032]ATO14662.1 hypothetical protein CO540_13175 [Micromonospora sp. WMMA2032]
MTGLLIALAAAVWSALCLTAGAWWAHRRTTQQLAGLLDRMGAANHAIGDLEHHRSVIADYVLTFHELIHRPRLRGAR